MNAEGGETAANLKTISEADVVVSQLFNMEKRLTRFAAEAPAVKVEFPALFVGFLWPFGGQSAHVKNAAPPHLVSGPYPPQLGDTFLNKLIVEGVTAEAALKRYLDLDIARVAHLDRLMELHLTAQASRDEKTGFAFARIIEARFRDVSLFLTPHHPAMLLTVHLIWGVFERLGVSPTVTEFAVQGLHTAPFPSHALPIHPGIIRHFGLRFVDKKSKYPYNRDGWFSFDEFVIRYMNYTWNNELYECIAKANDANPAGVFATLERALLSSPESAAGWRTMSLLLRRMHQPADAKSAALRAVELDPKDPDARVELVRALLAVRDDSGAEAEARLGVERFPRHAKMHHLLAEIYLQQERSDEGILAAKRALALRPTDRGPYIQLGELYAKIKDFEAAEIAFRNVGQAALSVRVRSVFAQVLYQQGKTDEALALAQELAQAGNAHMHALVGHIQARRNDLDAAETAFRKAAEIDPAFPGFRNALAYVVSRKQQTLAPAHPA